MEEYMGRIAQACAITATALAAETTATATATGAGTGAGAGAGAGLTAADRERAVVLGFRWQAAVVTSVEQVVGQVNSYLQHGAPSKKGAAVAAFVQTRW